MIEKGSKSIGLIEKQGSGIRRIVEYFAETQLPHPKFRNISDCFMVTVFALKETNVPNVTDKVGDKITENQIKILECIAGNPFISAQKIAEQIGITSRKIEDNIKKLKRLGLLERIGNPKSGFW